MEPGMPINDPLAAVMEHEETSSASYQSKNSAATAVTASLSSTGSSPPSSPSPSTRRRRTHQQELSQNMRLGIPSQRIDSSPLVVLKERRPPSLSTVTNMSESVSYNSSDGEFEENEMPQTEEFDAMVMPMNSSLTKEESSENISTKIDLEMGIVTDGREPGNLMPHHQPPNWRHSTSGRQRFCSTSPFTPPSVASSLSSSSFRSRRNRAATFDSPPSRPSSSAADKGGHQAPSAKNGPLSLRASLDAGMAAVRTWIRSRGSGSPQERSGPSGDVDVRPRSHSVTWQSKPSVNSSPGMASMNTSANEELDDLLQLDDLSIFTNNSARTDDSHLNNHRHRPASAPTISPPLQNKQSLQPRHCSAQHFMSHPDTILEELDEGGDGHMAAESRSRKRSQSEPDGRHIPDFLLGPPPTTRYHAGVSAVASMTRRRHSRTPKPYQPRHLQPPLLRNAQQQQQQCRNNNQAPPFARLSIPGRPRVENDTGTSLSSSAAAALSENPHGQTPSSSLLLHEFSDAGSSVETTSIPADSAVELTITPIGNNDVVDGSFGSPALSSSAQSSSFRNAANVRDDGTPLAGPSTSVTSTPSDSPNVTTPTVPTMPRENSARNNSTQVTDAERFARMRWIRINRRFQFVITVVALIFSLLLFAILICWVVLTSAFVLAFDKSCDVPLKRYFWLVTLQLVLDVFRSDIMRFVFHWDANSNQRIPARVIAYNITYLIYALLVLRLGVRSVFMEETTCDNTAAELYNASTAFVSLSIAAWATILFGYLLPFCVVATLLTCNGYNPTSHNRQDEQALNRGRGNVGPPGTAQPVFPAAYATTGAPPGTVDRLPVFRHENLTENARECCICMEDFTDQDVLVETTCKHIFHKQCCREWLRQARTCPVCRSDIPGSLRASVQAEPDSSSRIPIGPTGRPVVGLFRILRSTTGAIVRTVSSPRHAANEERAPTN
ncbi:hypothetical protein ACA910_018198 [Epithemia clementina (nom. ined.)]